MDLLIENALPAEYYRELEASFPGRETFKAVLQAACAATDDNKSLRRGLRHLRRANRRVNLPSQFVIANSAVPALWREFINFHSSDTFFQQLLDIFAEQIEIHFPGLIEGGLASERRGGAGEQRIKLDALCAINTPSWRRGEITGPHTDHPNKLFVGLYYFRSEGDSAGGDLLLYKRLEPVTAANLKWPKPATVEAVARVEYAPNTLVILLNTPAAVHGVTPRGRSKLPRRFVNFIAEGKAVAEHAALKL